MGCDIHAHVEVKIGDVWHHYNAPHVTRDYQLFAKMGNVRNHNGIEPLSDCRGIPQDISPITRIAMERWSSDAHSATHLAANEIEALGEWYRNRPEVLQLQGHFHGLEGVFGYSIEGAPLSVAKPFDDVRIVFWFSPPRTYKVTGTFTATFEVEINADSEEDATAIVEDMEEDEFLEDGWLHASRVEVDSVERL